MFDTKKFGGYLSRLRKNSDMTQSELADKLNLTRQAISRYELGDSFPDISILILISKIFGITLDTLINSGEPSHGEALILENVALGNNKIIVKNINDIVNIAPLLKPSTLAKLSSSLSNQGIDISNIVKLAEYLNDENVVDLLENAKFNSADEVMFEKLIPLLDNKSKSVIFQKILYGEMDWHLIKILIPYTAYIESTIEAAVIEGALPWEALKVLHEGMKDFFEKQKKDGEL